MYAIERWSSRSNPRRFGIPSRKSVSAEASSSSILARACANWARRRRIARLGSFDAGENPDFGPGRFADFAGNWVALRVAAALVRLLASRPPAVFFFMSFPRL